MKKIKIIIEKQDLDKNVIQDQKDFSKVREDYESQSSGNSLLTNIGIITAGIVVVVATIISIFSFWPSKKELDELGETKTEESYLYADQIYKAPYEEFDVPYEIFEIQQGQKVQLLSKRGSIIDIDHAIFVNIGGEEVEGEIELWFREFHNSFEIFSAGIPMLTQTEDGPAQLESAGMFEILAFQGEEELHLKEGKSIDVKLVSFNDSDEFNIYNFNNKSSEWDYVSPSQISDYEYVNPTTYSPGNKEKQNKLLIRPETDSIYFIQKTLEAADEEIIVKEKLGSDYFFELEINQDKTPELSAFERLVFKVNTLESNFDPKYYDVQWNDMSVEKVDGDNKYLISLTKEDTTIKLLASPIIPDNKSQKQKIAFEKNRKKKAGRKKERLSNTSNSIFIRPARFDRTNALIEGVIKEQFDNPPVYRTVQVFQLGLCNVDQPLYSYNSITKISFIDQFGQDVKYMYMYMADLKKNSVFNMGNSQLLRFNPDVSAVLWVISSDGHIGITNLDLLNKKNLLRRTEAKVKMMPRDEGMRALKKIID